MIPVLFDYASPSVFESTRDQATLGMSTNARRPVRFHGRVTKHVSLLRFSLRALGALVWSDDTWLGDGDYSSMVLDPVITVHPDRIFFEAFSNDKSVYGMLIVDRSLFETEGEVQTGTTNIDFTAWLWGALGEMRSSRETWFRVGAEGFELQTVRAGGRFEHKVDLPEDWVRGFLQLQGAMALPGTRVRGRPVDLLAAIRFLQHTKAKVAPRALRYEFEPDQEACIVLEPWEEVIPLKGAEHHYTESRVIRTWGRRRLRLLEPLLPFADEVEIYLKGRALPSFYAVKMPGMTFLLGLSGWTDQTWTGASTFDLTGDATTADEALSTRVNDLLRQEFVLSVEEVAARTDQSNEVASACLQRLCRLGRTIYDVQTRTYRHRELFEHPIDEEKLFPPDPRIERARKFILESQVDVASVEANETRKVKRFHDPRRGNVNKEVIHRDWEAKGKVGDVHSVSIVLNDHGRIIFGQCLCPFFRENLLNKGPCEHMVALDVATRDSRKDDKTSRPISDAEAKGSRLTSSRRGQDEEEDESLDDEEEIEDNDE
ncbi:hypothetical protein Pan216_36910 [Planctomycetes bacterium Pan216]|uniref:SWIM-type domain-containing protein n=1 Tax=Kolteria novifilia TaxID=2527975 RepID=A0A518B767_9BACT|nr:hypothetical protein Pan216_36910 [Planctomycetes bacterium Pan216]